MANTYTWNIVALDVTASVDGVSNVVNNIHWILNGTDGVNTESIYGTQSIEFDSNSSFIEYKDLSKAQVERWLESAIGDQQISNFKSILDEKLKLMANPVSISSTSLGLPWSVTV